MALSEAQKHRLNLHFLLLDQDSDGRIATTELGTLLRAAGLFPGESDLQALLPLVDPEGTGCVERTSFLQAMEASLLQSVTEEELREAFAVLDEDADGYISTSQLRHLLVNLGTRMSGDAADEIISDARADAEGHIHVDDLIALWMQETPQ